MLRFRFKVSNAAGKVRVGHITAASLDLAKQAVENNGYRILEISEAPLSTISRRDISRRHAYKPNALEFLEEIESAPFKRRAVLGTLTVLGLLLSLWHGSRLEPRSPALPQPHEVTLALSGVVRVPPRQRAVATLRFQMPEVPLGLIRDYDQVVDESGGYHLEYSFEGLKTPSYFISELYLDGQRVASSARTPLSGSPLSGQATLLAAPLSNR